ncbi:hypothetical protein K492DRAFT_206649 [Lichtheimia hyalospora FSU 10163]|nr:hypothetical protein K492DRAFT_206649 [Lichtheimia hyalospora FSU 10163]
MIQMTASIKRVGLHSSRSTLLYSMQTEQSYNEKPSQEQRREWEREQQLLCTRIATHDDRLTFEPETLKGLKYVGGVDLSFPENNMEEALACLSVLAWPSLKVVHTSYLKTRLYLPYIAGFLAFREVGPLSNLLQQLKETHPEIYPQVVLVDGNGRLHPRMCGIACHLGVVADIPTVGVAKNFLVIDNELDMKQVKNTCREMLHQRGDRYILKGRTTEKVYGAAVRTTDAAPNPVFVSQGHRVSLDTAIHIVMACSRYRIPEPIRRADLDSRAYIKNNPLFTK